MKKYILSLLLVIAIHGYSQVNYTQEEGKVTQYEMVMQEYEEDKDAEALVIYDLGDYHFRGEDNQGFVLRMKKRIKIKILKQAGLKEANFEIPYYMEGRNWEEIESLEGTTYNLEDGVLKKTILTSKNIFEEKINDNIRVKKIAFADVRVGSVIELNYVISTPYFIHMRKWGFQKNIPVVYSKLRYRAIPYYDYAYLVKGTDKFDEFNTDVLSQEIRYGNLVYKEMECIFGMKDIPAFRDEEFISSKEDYMIGLNFQLAKYNSPRGGSKEIISTWPAMCDDFLKDDSFGKYIRNSEKEAKKILPTLNLGNEAIIEQVEIITNYVKSNYNWNGFYGKYAVDNLSDFLKQKTGNSGNINLFLIGLLKAANIEVYPVILSTRGNGLIDKNYPFQQFFNYVVAQIIIDGKTYTIDATESLLSFNELPQRCINVEGLVVKPKSEEWVDIIQKRMSMINRQFTLKITPENNLVTVKAKFAGSGFDAYNYRKIYLGKEENLQKYLKDRNNIDIKGSIEIVETEKMNKPFSFSFSFDNSLEGTQDKLFIHPFCNLSITNNPFKQTTRTLPIDLIYLKGEIYNTKVEIPEGYKIEHLPESYSINNDLIKFDYAIERNSEGLFVNANYALKQIVYKADDYIKLKMAYADMIKKFSEMIVLVKN